MEFDTHFVSERDAAFNSAFFQKAIYVDSGTAEAYVVRLCNYLNVM